MFGISQKIENAARKTALVSASALLATVGAAFLTGAAWLLLVELRSPLFAATVIGGIFFGLALLVLALSTSRSHKSTARQPLGQDLGGLSPLQLVVVSFLQGIEQGASSKRKP